MICRWFIRLGRITKPATVARWQTDMGRVARRPHESVDQRLLHLFG